MKRVMAQLLILLLLLGLVPVGLAQQTGTLAPEMLVSLVHNAPNTGKMLPERFDPYQDTYLLTVASWVSRITFTPTTASNAARVTVNGQPVTSGQKSQIIELTNDPQVVQIAVSVYDTNGAMSAQKTYTVYLQRRPSERRTRVSAGYITQIEVTDGIANISADLFTLNYRGNTNLSSYYNDTVFIYKHKTAANCLFYYGSSQNPIRATDAQIFMDRYMDLSSNLYYLVYIEDEIVAIFPYSPDF